jgi:hypothetical protein
MRSLCLIVTLVVAYLLLRGQPERMPVLLRTCLAVLALAAGLGWWGRRRRPQGGTAASRRLPGWLDYLGIGAAVLALECGFVLFLSAVPAPLESAAAAIEVWLRPAAAAEREQESAGRSAGSRWLWDDYRRRPLPQRTNLKPGTRPEVFLRPEDGDAAARLLASRIYLHAFALGRYEGGAWSMAGGPPQPLAAAADGWVRLAPTQSGGEIVCRIFHATDQPGGQPLTALQGVVAAEVTGLTRLDEGIHLLPPADRDGYEYRTASRPVTLDDLPRDAPVAVPAAVPPEWLETPGGALGERMATLARAAAGEGTLLDRLAGLRTHLRTTLGYSLQTDNARNLDPLENFLFQEQRGHCEYFATAGALLARSLGVPSRVAYGWAGGTYYEGSNLFVFRAREAHAWAEVLLDGHGWVVLDPTPPGAMASELARTAAPEEKPPGADEVTAPTDAAVSAADTGLGLPLALTTAFGLPAVLLLLWRSRRSRGGTSAEGPGGSVPAGGYFAAFCRACQRRGQAHRNGTTLRRQLAAMADPPPFAAELLAYHYGVRYEGKPADRKLEQRLKKAADDWR